MLEKDKNNDKTIDIEEIINAEKKVFRYPKTVDFNVFCNKTNVYSQKGIKVTNFEIIDDTLTCGIVDTPKNINTINFLNTILDLNKELEHNKYRLTLTYKTSIFKKVTANLNVSNLNLIRKNEILKITKE